MTEALLTLLILLYLGSLWFTHRLGYDDGRLAGLHEADQRDLHRDLSQYQQGVFEALRRAAEFLNNRGDRANAAALPEAVLRKITDHKPVSESTETQA